MDLEKLKKAIKDTAEKKAHCDREDFMIDDVAGGNFDDAYYAGNKDGEILFARELLQVYFPKEVDTKS